MTTATLDHQSNAGALILLIIAGIILAVITAPALCGLYGVEHDISHGAKEHGLTVNQQVNNCLNDNGANLVMLNPSNEHWAEVCEIAPDTFGVRVTKKIAGAWQEITTYVERGLTTYEVELRLLNLGYMLMMEAGG